MRRIPTYIWLQERRPVVRIDWTQISEREFRAGPLQLLYYGLVRDLRWGLSLTNGLSIGRLDYPTREAAMRAAPRIKQVRELFGKPKKRGKR